MQKLVFDSHEITRIKLYPLYQDLTVGDTFKFLLYGNNSDCPRPVEDWIEERFRIDRRKLEELILDETIQNGQNSERSHFFFQNVMEQTGTVVTWPSKLKIGAKSKKDPHVKVAGSVDSVKKAKVS